jgi:hypothetical protein
MTKTGNDHYNGKYVLLSISSISVDLYTSLQYILQPITERMAELEFDLPFLVQGTRQR